MPLSSIDAISVAFEHTKQQLFHPFRWGQWLRLAILGLLTGELSSGGGCSGGGNSFSVPIPSPTQTPRNGNELLYAPQMDPHLAANLFLFIGVGLLILAGILLVWMYVGSVYRFILIDSIISKTVRLREGWHKWHATGRRFFLWRLAFQFATFMLFVILVGIPLGLAVLLGWFTEPKAHIVGLVLGGIAVFFLMLLFVLATLIVFVLAKDFMAPIMALENTSFADSWSRLLAMMKTDKGSYAGYLGMKLVLAIAVGIVFGIVITIALLVILIPVGGLTAIAIITGNTAGLTWTVGTVTLAVVAASGVFALILCVTSLLSVPVTVYFPAYSLYFFASRYPKLDAWLHPPPEPIVPPVPFLLEPPPLPPLPFNDPEPIG